MRNLYSTKGVSTVRNLWILIVLIGSIVKGNILHVSTTGDDESGDGSVDNPYLTIQKGIDEASSMGGGNVAIGGVGGNVDEDEPNGLIREEDDIIERIIYKLSTGEL